MAPSTQNANTPDQVQKLLPSAIIKTPLLQPTTPHSISPTEKSPLPIRVQNVGVQALDIEPGIDVREPEIEASKIPMVIGEEDKRYIYNK